MYMIEPVKESNHAQPNWKTHRAFGILLILISYAIATLVGMAVYNGLTQSLWVKLLAADVAATLVIWVCSLLVDNASVYDPYWSVQPIVILFLLLTHTGIANTLTLLLCLLVFLWGIRLTLNWASTFHGLYAQDWRYDLIKQQSGFFYPLTNLFGIQLMPTLIVFACIAPIIQVVTTPPEFTLWAIPGLLVMGLGTLLETVADRQLRSFHNRNPERSAIIREGLWKHSRHPNYLGEILVWWGAFFVCLSAYPSAWKFALGACLNTALFMLISIPMAEKRMAQYKENFKDYCRQTRKLLPFPNRNENRKI